MDDRISLRFNGKLLSLRMEDANLENIDRVAKARGQSRSEWMRLAMLTQLAVDLAEIGAPNAEPKCGVCGVPGHDPEAEHEIDHENVRVVPRETVEPDVFHAPPETLTPEYHGVDTVIFPASLEPEVVAPVERPNKWA